MYDKKTPVPYNFNLLIALLQSVCLFAGCVQQQGDPDNVLSLDEKSPIATIYNGSQIQVLSSLEPNQKLFLVSKDSCDRNPENLGVSIKINNAGVKKFYWLSPLNGSALNQISLSACEKLTTDHQTFISLSPSQSKEIIKVIRTHFPFCQKFSPPQGESLDQSWSCNANRPRSAHDIIADIDHINVQMIRKWKRLPYLVSRRLEILRQISLKHLEKNYDIEPICNVIKNSTRLELPLVLGNDQVSVLCENPTIKKPGYTLQLLSIGLRGIESLHKIAIKASNIGVLKIDLDNQGRNEIQVKLNPKASTLNKLSGQLQVYQDTGFDYGNCFFPILSSERQKAVGLALGIFDIDNSADLPPCAVVSKKEKEIVTGNGNSLKEMVSQYIGNSVFGETVFLVGNGRGKVLRLPPGEYDYELSKVSQTFRFESSHLSRGKFVWKAGQNKVISEL